MADTEKKVLSDAEKEAEKAAKKAKQERIKASKPKKEGSAASRAGKKIKKFWKDFTGTVKKVVWPGPREVVKSSVVVLASIIVVGLVILGFDTGLRALFDAGNGLAESIGSKTSVTTEVATNDADATTTASEETSTDETTTEETEETTTEEAAEETTTQAQSDEN